MKRGTPEFIEHMRLIGRKGGLKKVPKGFSRMSKATARAAQRKGGKARHDKIEAVQNLP